METLQLRLSLAGIDTPEDKLRELQNWLPSTDHHVIIGLHNRFDKSDSWMVL